MDYKITRETDPELFEEVDRLCLDKSKTKECAGLRSMLAGFPNDPVGRAKFENEASELGKRLSDVYERNILPRCVKLLGPEPKPIYKSDGKVDPVAEWHADCLEQLDRLQH